MVPYQVPKNTTKHVYLVSSSFLPPYLYISPGNPTMQFQGLVLFVIVFIFSKSSILIAYVFSLLSLLPSIFTSTRVFSNESVLCIRGPKYWSFGFSISPFYEYSRLISFRIDWFDLLAVQGTLESSPTPQFKSTDSSVLSFLYGPTLTSIHDYWKNHSFD